ncbi:MAG: hypothetical protein A2275_14880 [Bacteroidetes bacterium RIFOXYA12_FULL_35_11]|nr:MAG: hypothetical protein A2275_14880 [Bacteroidetes bacterium RIFOXYA12_FULL_35_11]
MFFVKDILAVEKIFALTSGPSQPEVQSFEPAQTNQMVDPFSGDFTYNIPLFELPGSNGGYPFNLSYHSGIGMDQEASWVGLGWNINAGAINRSIRGLPDDFNGDEIIQTLDMKTNFTAGVSGGLNFGAEWFGYKIKGLKAGLDLKVYYNNYNGMGMGLGLNVGYKPSDKFGANVGFNFDSQSGSSTSLGIACGRVALSFGASSFGSPSFGINVAHKGFNNVTNKNYFSSGMNFTGMSFADNGRMPDIPFETFNTNLSGHYSMGVSFFGLYPNMALGFFWNSEHIKHKNKPVASKAYGYMYLENANPSVKNQVIDFNREKDVTITKRTPNLPMTHLTYDYYSVFGQGIGEMYRPFRSEIGCVYDPNKQSVTVGVDGEYELGICHQGYSGALNTSVSNSGKWFDDDLETIYKFRSKTNEEPGYESVYFKSHGEKNCLPSNELAFLGNEDAVKVQVGLDDDDWYEAFVFKKGDAKPALENKFGTVTQIGQNSYKRQESKRIPRNTGIQTFTNSDVELLNEYKVKYFEVGADPMTSAGVDYSRTSNRSGHIAGITALNASGMRYVYALPIYNNKKIEKIFSIKENIIDGSSVIAGYDESNGSEGFKYYKKVETPPYAYSYLLTSVLGADYVDVNNNGPDEADQGYWVKFTYKKVAEDSKWRSPFSHKKASYNRGLRNFKDDNRASFVYGEKEVWLLAKAETNTHVAVFHVSNDREDGHGVSNEDGGLASDNSYKLDKISLYTRQNFQNNGQAIKEVNFKYEINGINGVEKYFLCKNVYNNNAESGDKGKLTLLQVSFSYGTSTKEHPYKFTYNLGLTGFNEYDENKYDCWGNYKSIASPDVFEFPYVNQSTVEATRKAEASLWNLEKIELPSGGKINIEYESDDYAYVQHRKAAQLYKILSLHNEGNEIYDNNHFPSDDVDYIYINLDDPNLTDEQFKEKYIEGLKRNGEYQLYFKVLTELRSNVYEYISGYADIDINNCGIDENGKGKIAVKKVKNTIGLHNRYYHPFAAAAWQFMKTVKPQLLTAGGTFDDEDPTSGLDKALKIKSMLGLFKSFPLVFRDYTKYCFDRLYGNKIDLSKSWIKLCNAKGRKYGGGNRVKQIYISDQWNEITGSEENAIYGQNYDYTTKDDKENLISSGVATYEPMTGGEENPLKYAKKYTQDAQLLKSPHSLFFEYPVNESLYPAPSVGYSKVTITGLKRFKSSTPSEEYKPYGTGATVHEFYTCKDYPVITDETPITNENDFHYIPVLIGGVTRTSVVASQGYAIKLNDMHGKPKAVYYYPQDKDGLIQFDRPTAYTLYEYQSNDIVYDGCNVKELNNIVPKVLSENNTLLENMMMGVEYDFFTDSRMATFQETTGGASVNVDWSILFPSPVLVPFPSFWPKLSYYSTDIRSITTNKVIFKSGILSKVTSFDGYAITSAQNLVYDKSTGQPVLTATNTQFKDQKFQYQSPAYHSYEGMRPAYENLGFEFSATTDGSPVNNIYKFTTNSSTNVDIAGYVNNGLLSPGDEFVIEGSGGKFKAYFMGTYHTSATEVDYRFYCENLNLTGGSYTFLNTRSGKRNMMDAVTASYVTLENPFSNNTISFGNFTRDYDPLSISVPNPDVQDLMTLFNGAWHSNVNNTFVYSGMQCVWNVSDHSFSVTTNAYCGIGGTVTKKYILRDKNGDFPSTAPCTYNSNCTVDNHFELVPLTYTPSLNPNELDFDYTGYHFLVQDIGLFSHELFLHVQQDVITQLLSRNFPLFEFQKVLSANAVNYYDLHPKDEIVTDKCMYATGEKGIWSVNKNFDYFDQRTNSLTAFDKDNPNTPPANTNTSLKNDGIFSGLRIPGFEAASQHFQRLFYSWVKKAHITANSSRGFDAESRDVLGQYSANLFDSFDFVIAKGVNTRKNTFASEGFENYPAFSITTINPLEECFGNLVFHDYNAFSYYTYYDVRSAETDFDLATLNNQYGVIDKVWSATDNSFNAIIWLQSDVLRNSSGSILLKPFSIEKRVVSSINAQSTPDFKPYFQLSDIFNPVDHRILSNPSLTWHGKIGLLNTAAVCTSGNDFNQVSIDETEAHSGKKSLKIVNGTSIFKQPLLNLKDVCDNRYIVSGWVKVKSSSGNNTVKTPNYKYLNTVVFSPTGSTTALLPASAFKGSVIDGWQKFELLISANDDYFDLKMGTLNAYFDVYFDDIRIAPINSSVQAYVYDYTNYRLNAILDENNYATFYYYDEQGNLFLTKKETEKGIKTIKEVRSNLLKAQN